MALRAHRQFGGAPTGGAGAALQVRDAQVREVTVARAKFGPLVEELREALDDLDVELAQVVRHWRTRRQDAGRDVLAVLAMRDVDGAAQVVARTAHELRQFLEQRARVPRQRRPRRLVDPSERRHAQRGSVTAAILAALADGQPRRAQDVFDAMGSVYPTTTAKSVGVTLAILAREGGLTRVGRGLYCRNGARRADEEAA